MADSEDDVPPLEDMSHAFQTACSIKPEPARTAQPESCQASQNPQAKQVKQAANGSTVKDNRSGSAGKASFAGMRRGFLVASPERSTASKAQKQPEADADVPFIRSNPDAAGRSLRLDEVQESLQRDSPLKDKSWINDELLAKVEADSFLAKSLQDPRMAAALTKFQKNPSNAFQEYKDDEEVQRFLKSFSTLLGDHFTKMADKQQQQQEEEEAAKPQADPEVEAALSRPEVREALTDAEVQRWMSLMRSDSAQAHAQLRSNSSPQFHRHLRVLFENGLLGIAK